MPNIIVVQIRNDDNFTLLYASKGFVSGLTVTGYLIYPNFEKSESIEFEGFGDGIYGVVFPYKRKTKQLDEKYGVVVKENGVPVKLEIIRMIN